MNETPAAQGGPPMEWRDEETGRRVRRVTPASLPAVGLYHHLRAFTTDGQWMLFSGRTEAGLDIHAFHLAEERIVRLTQGGKSRLVCTVPHQSRALVIQEGAYRLLDVPGGALRRLAEVPADATFATTPDVTADGRFLVGGCVEMTDEARRVDRTDRLWVLKVWRLHLRNTLFTIDLESGERKDFFQLWSWVDHLQCSPTDAALFTYVDQGQMQRTGNGCHVMRTDGSARRRVAEGGAHHTWSSDGRHIYYNDEYDHAAPWEHWRWSLETEKRERVLPKEEWNFHFLTSPDSRFLVGDGTWDNPYISLYRPGQDGSWRKERLCRRVTPNPRTEDQARFAPDGKSVFFNGEVERVPAIFRVFV